GKERVTVRQVLAHQAGLLGLREPQPPEMLLDWERTCALLAAEPPWWGPGTGHGEHALFYGPLCGELVRPADRRSLGPVWRGGGAGGARGGGPAPPPGGGGGPRSRGRSTWRAGCRRRGGCGGPRSPPRPARASWRS